MSAKQLVQVYLDKEQKEAIHECAKRHGRKISDEIRRAIDIYLCSPDVKELAMLDSASLLIEKELKSMVVTLDATNNKLDKVFAELDSLRTFG
jgi:hypothetical protein